jgi:hypothetical protein
MRGLRLSHLAVFVCVAACSPSKAIEPAAQQAPGNEHYQELAQLAANRMGGTGEIVHLSSSGGNTVNIGARGGSITINGLTATDALFFADTRANATVTQMSKTEATITFADTGQSIDLHFANHAAEVAIVGSLHYGV